MYAEQRCRVTLDTPEDLHRALFFRDALSIPALEGIGNLTVSPAPLTSGPEAEPADLAGDWARWWTELFLRRGRGQRDRLSDALHPPVPPDGALARAAAVHEADFHQWWATYPVTGHSGQKAALAEDLRTHGSVEYEQVAGRGQAVHLAVDVLALSGPFTRGIHRDYVVVSATSRRESGYPAWLTEVVFGAAR